MKDFRTTFHGSFSLLFFFFFLSKLRVVVQATHVWKKVFVFVEWIAFSAIPEDGRRKAYAESLAKAKAEEEAKTAAEKAREAAEEAKKLEEEVKKLSEKEARAATLAEEAQEKAQAAGTSVESILSKAKVFGSGLSWEKLSSQLTTAAQKPEEKPKVQIATVRGQAKARSLPAKKAAVKQPGLKFPALKPKEAEAKPKGKQSTDQGKTEVRKLFGGLFSQETVYVDEDWDNTFPWGYFGSDGV